ncbi:MAG: hypothetical protein R6U52_00570 [Kosmotogaceae bacterium]
MKTVTVDDNAHNILLWAKKQMKSQGIEKPSHSEAIRWMKQQIIGNEVEE